MVKVLTLFLIVFSISGWAQMDHTDMIAGPFESPQEVTMTCLACHDGIGADVIKTRHWKWHGDTLNVEGQGETVIGKKNLLNNFCIAVTSNWPRCTSCHIGYGWEDETFDFTNEENIDCLVCHEQTGTYTKVPTGAGMPADTVDLEKVAQSVGRPGIKNCGTCHFDGGGGTGVKHGDMDDALLEPTPELDWHMGALGFVCVDCHGGTNHKILGASHGSMAENENHISCVNGCHDEKPHQKNILNKHSRSVACETCHIPTIARGLPTKTWWDWSTAGKDMEVTYDDYGKPLYDKKKGTFEWKKDYSPEYFWYKGKAKYYLPGDKLESEKKVKLNTLVASIDDEDAKIYPFKVMRGKQPYDKLNKTMIIPHLFGKEGFWKTFDWIKASELGMKAAGLDFSGEVGWIETEMYWPVNHTVAPAENALTCTNCHGVRGTKVIDWKALGYKDDPMTDGSRFD